MQNWEREKANKGSECAKELRIELERLSPFKLKPTSPDVEGGFIQGLHKKPEDQKLDYHVLYEGKQVATIDVTGSNYTFERSQVMPVDAYKGKLIKESSVPVFIVYSMRAEGDLPLGERCFWIHGKDVVKGKVYFDHWDKDRHNYHTNKEDWHRGLKSFIQELVKLTTC